MTKRLTTRDSYTALSFDGSNDSLKEETIDMQVKSGQARTVSFYIKPKELNQWVFSRISGSGDGLRTIITSAGLLSTWWENDGALVNLAADTAIGNDWNHVVMVFEDTEWTYYINGSPAGNTTFASRTFTVAAGVYFGRAYTGNYGNVYMDDVRVWDSALSADQASELYYNNVVPSGLLVEYLLNESSGTTAIDTSGNNKDGTISGAVYVTDVKFRLRKAVVDNKASLSFLNATTDVVDVPYTFPTDEYSVSFWAKSRNGELISNEQFFRQTGSFGLGRQGANDIDIYAYLNASGDYAGLRRLRLTQSKSSLFAALSDMNWHHFVYVLYVDGSNDANCTSYADGVFMKSSTVDYTGDASTPTGDLGIGSIAGGNSSYSFNGNMRNVKIYNRKLVASEISSLYYKDYSGYEPDAEWLFDEGAGAVVYDTSVNSATGAITGTTWSSDTPSKKRKLVNENLIENGDFEFIPPFVSNQNQDNWLDGTLTGRTYNNKLFNWYINIGGNGAITSIQSTEVHGGNGALYIFTEPGGYAEVKFLTNQYRGDNPEEYITLLPSTSYTLTYWLKTELIGGDTSHGGDGIFMTLSESDGQGNSVLAWASATIKSTTNWTKYTRTFTSNADTRALNIECRIYGHNGADTLTMKAWFDDIVLKPTTPEART